MSTKNLATRCGADSASYEGPTVVGRPLPSGNAALRKPLKLDPVPALHGYVVEWVDQEQILVSKGPRVYQYDPASCDKHLLFSFPTPASHLIRDLNHYTRRFFRHGVYNLIRISPQRYFVSFAKQLGIFQQGLFQPIGGLARPTRVLRSGCALSSWGDLYFGEYIPNAERGPVTLYRLAAGATQVEPVYTFAAKEIRHVHGVYHDPYTDWIWVACGDVGHESRIMLTKDRFKSLELVGSGSEDWRCVSMIFREDCVLYGTDAEFMPNKIFALDRRTAAIREIAAVDGTVFYSQKLGQNVLMGTTAELCGSNQTRTASIWSVAPDFSCRVVRSFKKDSLHRVLFQFGHFQFPHLNSPGRSQETYVTGLGLRGADAKTFRVSILNAGTI